MKKLTCILSLFLISVIPVSAENFSREDAKNLTLKACALIEKVGIEKARDLLHNIDGEYREGEKGELYVSVIDWHGNWLAYPPKPAGVGRCVLNAKDPDGKFLVKDMIALAKSKGEGWVQYRWKNPKSGKIAPKSAYVKRVLGADMYVSAGVYN